MDVARGGTASFSADLNMETSDYGISGATQVDPATRSPHTHHISMTNATVSYDSSACQRQQPCDHVFRFDGFRYGYDHGEWRAGNI